jgi:hypothetical protein
MTNKLTVIEQREVTFYDDELTAVRADDGRVYASLRHMCDALGLNSRGQSQRVDRHAVLKQGKGVCKIHTPGGAQSIVVLRADLVPLWLAGVRTSMVNEEIRPKLERFQEEAAVVLWEAFQEGRLTAEPSLENLLKSDSPAAQAYQMAQAIMQMARQQLILESRMDDHENRLEVIEAQMSAPAHAITQSQAMQISQAVKAVAMAMPEPNFGQVYGQLYREYEITSYKNLPANKFQDAMNFLTEWFVRLTGDEKVPF